MSFKKPFQAKPVVLGEFARAQDVRKRRSSNFRTAKMAALGAAGVFAAGMIVTNWDAMPKYYPNCDWARSFGAAPINRGEPGYRSKLDADDDGVACEPYPRP